jgi:hypothetical protein
MAPDPFGDAFAAALAAPQGAHGPDLEAVQLEITDALQQALDHMNDTLPAGGDVRATLGPGMAVPGQVTRQFGFERQSDGFEVSAFSAAWQVGYPVTVRMVGGSTLLADDRPQLIEALTAAMTASAPLARRLAEG